MAVACSIFTLDGRVQLFWAAFDMPVTVVPLKVALGFLKIDFWAFQKNNQASECQVGQKSNFPNPNATFNGTTVMGISKASQNN